MTLIGSSEMCQQRTFAEVLTILADQQAARRLASATPAPRATEGRGSPAPASFIEPGGLALIPSSVAGHVGVNPFGRRAR